MSATPPDHGLDGAVLAAILRLEGKVDVALATHGERVRAAAERLDDHEARMRALEGVPSVPDLEERLRAVESRPQGVSYRALWGGILGAIGAASALVPILDRLFA